MEITVKDLVQNPKKYARLYVKHNNSLTFDQVVYYISNKPRTWIDEISRLIKLEKQLKKEKLKWRPSAKAIEVFEMIKRNDPDVRGLWTRYRPSLDALQRHGYIKYWVVREIAEFKVLR